MRGMPKNSHGLGRDTILSLRARLVGESLMELGDLVGGIGKMSRGFPSGFTNRIADPSDEVKQMATTTELRVDNLFNFILLFSINKFGAGARRNGAARNVGSLDGFEKTDVKGWMQLGSLGQGKAERGLGDARFDRKGSEASEVEFLRRPLGPDVRGVKPNEVTGLKFGAR